MGTTAIRDYYGILGVTPQASSDDIRHAYRRLAKLWHPDRYRGAPEALRQQAERRMRLLTEANSTLGDPGRRAIFDRERRLAGLVPPSARDQSVHPTGTPFTARAGINVPGYQPSANVGATTVGENGLGVFAGLILGFLALGAFGMAGRGGLNVGAIIAGLIGLGLGTLAVLSFIGEGPIAGTLRAATETPKGYRPYRYAHEEVFGAAPEDLSIFEELVRDAIEHIPAEYDEQMQNLAIFVEQEPSPELLRRMDTKPGWTLLGLYEGLPLTKQGAHHAGLPEHITLFQGPIERHCLYSHERIEHQIKATLLHELAHHFGIDHDEMPIWVKA